MLLCASFFCFVFFYLKKIERDGVETVGFRYT